MNKALRGTLKVTGLVLGVLVVLAAAAALLVLFDKPLVRSFLRRQLSRGPGVSASFSRLDYTVFPLRVTVDGLAFGQEDVFQKLGGSLVRVDARGSFWRIVRRAKPAFDAIEVDGLSLKLEQKAASAEPLDIEKILLQVSDTLAWAKSISITSGRLSIGLMNAGAEIENLDLVLTSGPAANIVAYSIGRGDVRVNDKGGALVFAAGLASSGQLRLASPLSAEASFDLTAVRFKAAGLEDSFDKLSLAATASFDTAARQLTVSRLKIGLPGLLGFEGSAAGRLGQPLFLEAAAEARIESLATAAALARPVLPPGLLAAEPRGRAVLSGKYTIQRSDTGSKDDLAVSLSLEEVELDPVIEGRRVHVHAGGRIDAAGPSADPRLSADLRASTQALAASGLTLSGSELRLTGSANKRGADISLLEVRLDGVAYDAAEGKRLAVPKAALTGRGTVDLVRKSVVLTSLDVGLPGLAPLRISGRYGTGKGAFSELRLDGRGLDVAALRALAGPFTPAGFSGWDLGGTLDLSLSGRRPAASPGDWRFSGTVSLAGAKFNDPSFTIAGEGLDPVLKLEGTGSPSKGLAFTASLDVSKGESLWKSLYIAWAKHPLKLTAAGRYDPASGAIDGLTARVLLPEVGSVDISGSARLGPPTAFDVTAESRLSLGPLYSLYTQAGVAEAARMKIEGSLGANLLVRRSGESLMVAGRVTLAGTNVENPGAKALLVGISADVPLSYESAPARPADQSLSGRGQSAGQSLSGTIPDAGLPEAGYLRIGQFQTPLLALESVSIDLRAGPNALAVEPVSLPLFGGRLEIGRTVFRLDPASGSFHGLGSLALRGLDISKFPIQSPQFKLTGKVEAEFPRLDIGADRIAIAGRGEASVFGGKIVLRDLGVSKPFDPGRSISLDVDLVDLDMKKLTDEVPFGEVTGIVRGEIRELVITYGQPESFVFRIESVPRKGVPQTFSLKAVDNLTVISSGQKASGGTSSFWMKFVRGFRYEKLGIISTLHNDTFTLNGTVLEGGVEYLVKKPALFGISVVNREPGKKISFKEMTSRLKRVGQ
jgi:hypothetical protein